MILHDDDQGRRTGNLVERFPRWSPDGRWIAYIAEREGRVELWRSDIHGRRERALRAPGDVRDFAWVSATRLVIATSPPRAALDRQRRAQIDFGFRVEPDFSPAFSLLPNPDIASGRAIVVLDLLTAETSPASDAQAALLGARAATTARIGPRDSPVARRANSARRAKATSIQAPITPRGARARSWPRKSAPWPGSIFGSRVATLWMTVIQRAQRAGAPCATAAPAAACGAEPAR